MVFMGHWDTGVAIFFVLSGFLITIRYQHGVEPSWAWAKRYLQNRIARIYPVYFFLTALSLGLFHLVGSPWGEPWALREWASFTSLDKLFTVGTNLTLTRAYFDRLTFQGLITAWSLTVEETFYLLAPIILLTTTKRPWRLLAWVALLLAVGMLLVSLLPPLYMGLMANTPHMLKFTFFGRAAEFGVGMALAFWLQRQQVLRQGFAWTFTAVSLLLGFQILYCLSFVGALPVMVHYLLSVTYAGAVALLFAGLILEHTWLRQALETTAFDLLGKCSYVFYLIHVGILDEGFRAYVSPSVWVRLPGHVLISILLYKFVEHPIHAMLTKRRVTKPYPVVKVPA